MDIVGGGGKAPSVQAVRRHHGLQRASAGEAFSSSLTRRWPLALFATATLAALAAIEPGLDRALSDSQVQRVEKALAIPARVAAAPLPPRWHTIEVQPGQTLGQIFASRGLSQRDMNTLLAHPGARAPLSQLRVGARLGFLSDEAGNLQALRFDRSDSERVELRLRNGGVEETVQTRDVQTRVLVSSARIETSLFAAGAAAGLRDATLLELASVFGYDIDFAQDIRVGDSFTVMYEEIWRDGEFLRSGDIVAAVFRNQGREYTAYRYTTSDGKLGYYDDEGRPVKKSFLRMPIEFARISSRFSSARRHPILGTVRAHRGVDYAARAGTPIHAAGDARVTFAGWRNGYGLVVILDHGRGYTTLYGHMSRLGKYRVGQRVAQGAVIGYVGMTGLATAPHLHYEFRVNGVHRNPLTVTLPKPEPLPPAEMARFTAAALPLRTQLALLEARHLALR